MSFPELRAQRVRAGLQVALSTFLVAINERDTLRTGTFWPDHSDIFDGVMERILEVVSNPVGQLSVDPWDEEWAAEFCDEMWKAGQSAYGPKPHKDENNEEAS